jgi:tRNA/rRNA methyltransferase
VLTRIRLVLHRPQSAENLGAAARAMKNFGLRRLAVVAPLSWAGPPRGGGPGLARDDVLARAARMARKAGDLLQALEVHQDLRGALGPATWTCGTTSRALPGRPQLEPRQLAAELWRRSTAGEVAVVFGEERRGLSDAELDLCQAVCTIPTHPDYDSMNLAQAVAVVAYEVGLAARAAAGPAAPEAAAEPARHATVEALWALAQEVLARAGYLNPQNPEHILAELRHLLARADATQREVELVAAALRAIQRQQRLGAP